MEKNLFGKEKIMPKFAVLSGFIVENVIVAEQKTDAEQATNKTCIEVSDSDYLDIGWLYQDGVFVDPNPPIIEEPMNL